MHLGIIAILFPLFFFTYLPTRKFLKKKLRSQNWQIFQLKEKLVEIKRKRMIAFYKISFYFLFMTHVAIFVTISTPLFCFCTHLPSTY